MRGVSLKPTPCPWDVLDNGEWGFLLPVCLFTCPHCSNLLCRSVAEAKEQRKADLIAAIVRRREAKRAALMPEPAPTPPSTPSGGGGGGEGANAAAASALVRGGPYRGTSLTLYALPTWGGARCCCTPFCCCSVANC